MSRVQRRTQLWNIVHSAIVHKWYHEHKIDLQQLINVGSTCYTKEMLCINEHSSAPVSKQEYKDIVNYRVQNIESLHYTTVLALLQCEVHR